MDVASSGQELHVPAVSIVPPKPERNRKKFKLTHKEPETTDIAKLRKQIGDHKRKCQEQLKEVYRNNLTELYYLQNGLNYMDVLAWKKKTNIHLARYLQSFNFDAEDTVVAHLPIKSEQTCTTPIRKLSADVKLEAHGMKG